VPDQSAEVADLENEIAELRRTNDEIRQQVGGQGVGAVDPEDTAAALTNIEENEAVLGTLELRLANLKGSDRDEQ
jgi:hypothetical protein